MYSTSRKKMNGWLYILEGKTPPPNIYLDENKRVDSFVEDKLDTVDTVESIYSRINQLRQTYGRIRINGLTLYIWRKNTTGKYMAVEIYICWGGGEGGGKEGVRQAYSRS